MWRYVFFFSLVFGFPLFSDDEWDEDEEDSYLGDSLVTYGGMSFICDSGCGNPDYDSDAKTIQYLYSKWLPKPLYGTPFASWELDNAAQWGLPIWKYGKLFDEDLKDHFEGDDFQFTHDEFLQISSQILRDLDQIYCLCQGEIGQHERNIKKIKKLQKEGVQFVEMFGGEYVDAEWDTYDSVRIKGAIEDEKKGIDWCNFNLEKYDQYRDYADSTFRLIDSLYKGIFTWCLQNHQPEGIAFHAALENLLASDLDGALDQLRYLIGLAEEQDWDEGFIARINFLKGQVENELCLYSDAILDLTYSIQNDPSCKEAYLERARAYFETGQFEEAFRDYLASGIKNTAIDPKDESLFTFASGLVLGASQGALEGIGEFVPSMLTSVKTLGSGVWSFAQKPIGVSKEFAQAVLYLIQSIKSAQDISYIFIPELKDLIAKWNQLSSFKRGELCGHIIGKYGIDIFLTFGATKGIKTFVELRRASAVHTFETCLKSEINAVAIKKAAKTAQLARDPGSFIDKSFRLKNAASAIIRDKKITNYALTNPGKSKGFKGILGYNESNWQELKAKIECGVLENKAKFHKIDQYGLKFTVDMVIEGPKGKALVRTGWIYYPESTKPELTTLYLLTE